MYEKRILKNQENQEFEECFIPMQNPFYSLNLIKNRYCVLYAFNLNTHKILNLPMILIYILTLEIKQDYFSFFCKEQRVSESSLSSSSSKGLLTRYFGTTCY